MKIIARMVRAFGLTELDDDEDGHVPFCSCGHFEYEHATGWRRMCRGLIGAETCTCHGYREAKRSKEMRYGEA